jgi:osmotically inducible lipoprotein OsmB
MPRCLAAMLVPVTCLAALAGCGDSEMSRGTSGAAIGAGTGAAVCAVTIIGIVPCAIAGGALGAAGGIATAGPDEPAPPATAAAPADVASTDKTSDITASPQGEPVATPQPRVAVTAEPLR